MQVLLRRPLFLSRARFTGVALIGPLLQDIKKTTKALRDSEERLRTFIDNVPSLVSLKDVSGKYLLLNNEYERQFGMTLKNFQEKEAASLFPREVAERFTIQENQVLESKNQISREQVVPHVEGPHTHLCTKFPVLDDTGKVTAIGTISNDITDNKRAELLTQRLGRTVEQSLNEIYEFDAETFLFTQANRGARENIGYTMDELKGMTPWNLKPEISESEFKLLIVPLRDGGLDKLVFETIHQRKDGSNYDVEVHLQLMAAETPAVFIAFINDITERKKAEKALKESEERFRDIAEAASDFFWELDEDLRFVFVSNPKAWMESGQSPGGEIIGKTRWEAVGKNPEQDEEWREHIKDLKAQKPFRDFLSTYIDTNGRNRHWHVSGIPIFDEDGKFSGYRGASTDITQQMEAEEDRRVALTNAEEANQAKSEFLATMSHEFRTPLNAILGFADILSQQYLGPIGQKKYLEYAADIQASGKHLLELVNDLLDISTIEAGKHLLETKPFSTHDLISDCTRTILEQAKDGNVEVLTEIQDNLPPIMGDKRAVKQILLNLLSNAVKFTPSGEKVTIFAGSTAINTTIKVADTGIGIPEEILPNLTEPFVRGKTDPYLSNEGTGLGLAIAKSLIDLHGGNLEITSVTGQGTTVSVTLPNDLS